MAHTKSSKKRIRQDERQRERNRARLSRVRTTAKRAHEAAGRADAAAEALVRRAASELDRAANRNLIHPNAAARQKSRLAKRLAQLRAGSSG